jgi:hypothetical protein
MSQQVAVTHFLPIIMVIKLTNCQITHLIWIRWLIGDSMKPIWKKPFRTEDAELWLGVPSWDPDNKEGKLSIKFAYRKNGKIPRTAPEVPEEVVTDMVLMLADHGRLSSEDKERLEPTVSRKGGLRQQLDDREVKQLASYGATLLKYFHQEFEKDPEHRDTEYRRGQVTAYRHLLDFIYGARQTEGIVDEASREAGYTVPPAGPMTEDGKGYYGFDSGSHTYIGKLDEMAV